MPIISLNSHRNSNITRMGIRQEVTSRMASASMRSFSVCLNFSSVALAALPMLSLTLENRPESPLCWSVSASVVASDSTSATFFLASSSVSLMDA